MKVIDVIKDAKKTLFSFEILPPLKGKRIESIYEGIETLMEFDPKVINGTYPREEYVYKKREKGYLEKIAIRKRPGTDGICAAIINRYNVEAVPHLICGGFSKEETENALIESRYKYQTIFDNVSDGLIYLNTRGKILNVNEHCLELYGGSSEELVGKHFTKLGFISQKSVPALKKSLKLALTQERFTSDFEFVNKKGIKRYLECSTTRIWENDKVSGLIVAARDISERKIGERALRESEEKWRSLTENSPEHIMLMDLDYNIKFINHTVPDLTKEEVIGRCCLDFMAPQSQSIAETAFENVIISGESDTFETMYVSKSGEQRFFGVHVSAIKNSHGKITALISASHDISKRKQREQALAASESRYRNLIEHAPVGIHEIDLDGKILSMNSTGLGMLTVKSIEEVLHKKYLQTIHKKDRPRIERLMQQAFAGAPSQFEFSGTGETGSRLFSSSFIPIPGADGEVIRIMGISRDITAQKRAERAVLESEQKFRTITTDSLDGITVADLDGNYIFVNPTFCKMVGYSQEELLRLKVFDMRGPSQKKSVFGEAKKTDSSTFQVYLKRKDGSEFVSEILGKPIQFNGEECVLGIVRDITERVKVEERIRASESSLKEAQQLAKLGNWELDLRTNELTWSDEVYRIFEVDPKSFGATYEAFLENIHQDDREMVDRAYTDSLKNRTPYEIVHRLLLNDEQIKYVQERCETIYDNNNKPLRSVGTVQDINDRKLAEEALSESENR